MIYLCEIVAENLGFVVYFADICSAKRGRIVRLKVRSADA